MGKAWIHGLVEHGKEICSSFKSNEVIKIKSNRKSRNKSEKFSKKESSEIRDVTDLPPLEKSRPRDWLLREPSQTYRPSETGCFSGFLLTAYCSQCSNPIY